MNKLHYYHAIASLIAITGIVYTSITAANENNLTKQQLISEAEKFVLEQLDPDSIKTIDVEAMPIDQRVQIPRVYFHLNFLLESRSTKPVECFGKSPV
jgi:hypothetical protein